MKSYIARRFLYMLLLLVMSSIVSFLIITLPPGDFLTHYLVGVGEQGKRAFRVATDKMLSVID